MVERGLDRAAARPTRRARSRSAAPGRIEELLDAAGLRRHRGRAAGLRLPRREPRRVVGALDRDVGAFSRVVGGLSPAEHYALRDAVDAAYAPYVRDDGSLEIPARALMAAASA